MAICGIRWKLDVLQLKLAPTRGITIRTLEVTKEMKLKFERLIRITNLAIKKAHVLPIHQYTELRLDIE